MPKRPFGQRFREFRENNTVLGMLFFASLLLSSLVIVVGAGIWVVNWYDDTFQWRAQEYDKLRSLHAGFTLERFRAELGTPVFFRIDQPSHLRESTFRRRDYWVQAVSRGDGTVLMYSVISCDQDFKPGFPIEGGSKGATVTLRGSKLDAVLSDPRGEGLTADYFQGVTANTYYFELYYGGNPSNYKSFAWGLSDGCPNGDQEVATVELGDAGTPKLRRGEYHGDVSRGGRSVQKFRHRAFVNAYAETAPGISFDRVTRGFQIGVDRILTRTVP